jgi:hypothetical protein
MSAGQNRRGLDLNAIDGDTILSQSEYSSYLQNISQELIDLPTKQNVTPS